jgi:hypothetical protein
VFRNGVLMTKIPVVQRFLENHPQFDKFEGNCPDIRKAMFTVFDKAQVTKSENSAFKERLKAANKIAALELEDAKDMLIRVHGSFFKIPEDAEIEDLQNMLVDYMDSSEEAVAEILKGESNVDDEMTVLIGRLLEADALSFTAVDGQVAKRKGAKWEGIKAISHKEYTLQQREKMFTDFLLTEAGKPLLDDLNNLLKSVSKKPTGGKTK